LYTGDGDGWRPVERAPSPRHRSGVYLYGGTVDGAFSENLGSIAAAVIIIIIIIIITS